MNIAGLRFNSATYPASTAAPTANASNTQKSTDSRSSTASSSQADAALIAKLKARDQQVRRHEQAHLAAAGGLAVSAASFTYQKGPDGVSYAIGGEVSIDTSPGRTPEETISRARTIRAAALAPADPSGQDQAVAAQASQMAQEAQRELARQKADGQDESGKARQRQVESYYGSSAAAQESTVSTWA